MRVTTLDPMTLNDVKDLENACYLIEGEGDNAIKIYFESEQNKQEYLELEMHSAENSGALNKIFAEMAEDPTTGTIN